MHCQGENPVDRMQEKISQKADRMTSHDPLFLFSLSNNCKVCK